MPMVRLILMRPWQRIRAGRAASLPKTTSRKPLSKWPPARPAAEKILWARAPALTAGGNYDHKFRNGNFMG